MPKNKPKASDKIMTNDIAEEEFWADAIKEQQENPISSETEDNEWLDENYDGQLSVDVYQTENSIVIKSTIAGVKSEDIDVSINNDMVTIRGLRQKQEDVSKEDYFYQECYWGGFSRSIILPVEVREDKIDAVLENGILTVILPKMNKVKSTTIKVKEKK